jgi:hypothetical protein
VAVHRLGRTDTDVIGVIAKDHPDRFRFHRVVRLRRSAVSINVPTCSGRRPPSATASRIAFAAPPARGIVRWCASADIPNPTISA